MNNPRKGMLVYLAICGAVAAILFLRLPGAFIQASFFAEDGTIFFKQQYEYGLGQALFIYHAGYLHFVPRILAWGISSAPLIWQPALYSLVSLGIATFALTFFVLPGFRPVIADDSLRAVIVLVLALMPNQDSLMKLAYVNFYMALILALATLMKLPENPRLLWLLFGVISLAAWTTPVGIVCLPLAVWRSVAARNGRERVWWGLIALQVTGYFLTAQKEPGTIHQLLHDPAGVKALVKALSYKLLCVFHLGDHFCDPEFVRHWYLVVGAAALCLGAALAAYWKARKPVMLALLYLIFATSSMFVLRPTSWPLFHDLDEICWHGNQRYFMCGTFLLCVFWGVAYEALAQPWAAKSPARTNLCLIALLAWLNLHEFSFRQWEWHPPRAWTICCRQIADAKKEAASTRTAQTVHIYTSVPGVEYDLKIAP